MEVETFNPQEEEKKGNIEILWFLSPVNSSHQTYSTRCRKCHQVYRVLQQTHYYPWWHWKIKIPDAWTFDDNFDFPSPDKSQRLVYEDLSEVAMGGPLRGDCFLETADKQRIKIHDTAGGPPLWETTGQFVAIPIWTEHKGQRLGVLNVTTRELNLYKDPVGGYHLHTGSFENNVIKIGNYTKCDFTRQRILQTIKLA